MDDKKVNPEILNTMFTLMANFSSEEKSKVEEIRQEYIEREHEKELEHNKNMKCIDNKNKICVVIVASLFLILAIVLVIVGFIANNAIIKHYEMDKLYQEDIVVEFETWVESKPTDKEFSEINTGDNAKIGTSDTEISGDGNTIQNYPDNNGVIGDNNDVNIPNSNGTGGVD